MITVYLSIPVSRREYAAQIEAALKEHHQINVLNPCEIVHANWSKEEIPSYVADKCWQMIKASDAVILYTDYYGRDCAAEVGYATAQGKPIFPFYLLSQAASLQEDWMIKSSLEPSSEGLDSLVEKIFSKFSQSSVAEIHEEIEYRDQSKIEAVLHR